MVLKKVGAVLLLIAIFLILIKLSFFFIKGDYSDESTMKFTDDIVNLGVKASIPLEITIISALGGIGVILIIIDRFFS